MKNNDRYTDKKYWENYWEEEDRIQLNFYFSDLLDEYIDWKKCSSYMEIGGAPGNILAYINKQHGLKVSTIDFTQKTRIEKYLKSAEVSDYAIYDNDFSEFDVTPHRKKYSVVASWGFVEHFEKNVTADFISKHKEMVADDGYLVIELPNIRKFIWLLYSILNHKIIKTHNLKIMDLNWLKKQIMIGDEFEILYASYYFTMNEQNEYFLKHERMRKFCMKIVKRFRNAQIKDNTKCWFYPYIVIIAKRKMLT